MYAYTTPGVYFEQKKDRNPPLYDYRTDIAGFVGIAQRGPLDTPVQVESWEQFVSAFGTHIAQGYLAYAVEGFFANGGARCWVVRVADPATAQAASLPLYPEVRLDASSQGVWGNEIEVQLRIEDATHVTILLRTPRGEREIWRNLSTTVEEFPPAKRIDTQSRYLKFILNHPERGSNLVRVNDGLSINQGLSHTFRELAVPQEILLPRYLVGGKDGLAGLTIDHVQCGLKQFEKVDEVSIVAIPDIMPKPRISTPVQKLVPPDCSNSTGGVLLPHPILQAEPEFPPHFSTEEIRTLQHDLIAHCTALKDRFAILDIDSEERDPQQAIDWRNKFDTTYGALYFPGIAVPDPVRLTGLLRIVPPSGHIAGTYARGDRTIGVHKPPANAELRAVKDVVVAIEDELHGYLNEHQVNIIRAYKGRGIRVGGARTLSRDMEWCYINVRRLVMMIEERIDEGLQWTVFEPNDRALWGDVERNVREFLQRLWRRGMLDGAEAEQAFYVKCDETTNPPSELEQGRLFCEIGLNPPWPAEFVIVRIGITEGGAEMIMENGA